MTKTKNTKIGNYLEKNKISLERLAAETDIAYSTVRHIVIVGGNPAKDKIDRILKFLKCKYEDVF